MAGMNINKGTVKCTLERLSKKLLLNILVDSVELDTKFFAITLKL